MKHRLAGLFLVAILFALPSVAQAQVISWADALTSQLTANGVADPANATDAEMAAAVETLLINNPTISASEILDMVAVAVRTNPNAYMAIAEAAAVQAAAQGKSAAALEEIAAVAIGVAGAQGVDTTNAAQALAATILQRTGVAVNSARISENSNTYYALEIDQILFLVGLDAAFGGDLIFEENPNQDASPS